MDLQTRNPTPHLIFMNTMICRRCFGRGFRIEEESPCYLCDGKGNISIEPEVLKKYFEEIRDRYVRVMEWNT